MRSQVPSSAGEFWEKYPLQAAFIAVFTFLLITYCFAYYFFLFLGYLWLKTMYLLLLLGGGKSVYQTGKISKALVENKGCRTGASRSGLCPGSAPVTCSDGKPTSTSLCWGRLLPRAALSLGRRCEWFP